jgi:Protein of unknown function (DUF433)
MLWHDRRLVSVPSSTAKAVEAAVNLPLPQRTKGTHVPVWQILRRFAHAATIEDLLEQYLSLTREGIFAYLGHAASLASEQVTLLEVLARRSNAVPARDGRVTHG